MFIFVGETTLEDGGENFEILVFYILRCCVKGSIDKYILRPRPRGFIDSFAIGLLSGSIKVQRDAMDSCIVFKVKEVMKLC